jgi:hypothetical protein
MRSLLASSLFALPLLAQSALLDRAAALPPELYADVVLRLAEAGKLDVEEPAELLERIFLLANQVKFPVRPRYGAGLSEWTESLTGVMHGAGNQQLDRLSIQVRVAFVLKSAKLFREIDPTPPPQTCDDLFIYQPDIYYENLWRFPDAAPDAFRRISRSSQLAPAIRLLGRLPNANELTVFLAGAIPEIHDSWRSFAPAALASLHEARAHPALLAAWRTWFTNHMNGRRCSSVQELPELPKAITLFNAVADTPIDAKDLKASGVDKTPPSDSFGNSPKARANMRLYRSLCCDPQKAGLLPDAEKQKPEWHDRLREFLSAIAEWKPTDGETAREVFHQRAMFYGAASRLISAGEGLRRVTAEHVAFLALSPMRTEHPTEWLENVDRLLSSSNPYAAEEIRRSGDLALNVLLETETLAPGKR